MLDTISTGASIIISTITSTITVTISIIVQLKAVKAFRLLLLNKIKCPHAQFLGTNTLRPQTLIRAFVLRKALHSNQYKCNY